MSHSLTLLVTAKRAIFSGAFRILERGARVKRQNRGGRYAIDAEVVGGCFEIFLLISKRKWRDLMYSVTQFNPFNASCSKSLLFEGFSAILV